jgi:predicted RNA methylase
MGYFQALTADFFSEGIDLDPEHTYLLKGAANGSDVYVGKVFVSEQDIESYTVHPSKYTETVASNNYIILD